MATAPTPKNYSVSDLKSNLFEPALTSNFEVYIPVNSGSGVGSASKAWKFIKEESGFPSDLDLQTLLLLSCSEASLPGSSLATHELNNDVTGITQRYAYRRLYDDRADFTFYVTSDTKSNYSQIKVFERWLQYISGEQNATSQILEEPYRVAWPDDYKTTIYITKFDRTVTAKTGFGKDNSVNGDYTGKKLEYTFFNAYPISISSMPVSYDSSSLLKCSVSFTYDKYLAKKVSATAGDTNQPSQSTATGVPNPANVSYTGGSVAQNAFTGNASISGNYFNTAPNQNNRQVVDQGVIGNTAGFDSNVA